MPDIGWMEILVIGVVALIVAGPKDLLQMMRKAGQAMGKVRAMAKDFQRAMDEAADEAGVGDMKRDFQNVSKYANPKKMGMDALKDTLDDIDPSKYEDGSETQKVAEAKAARQKIMRQEAEARRQERDAATIAAKEAATAPTDASAPVEAEAPELPPARTGTSDT